MTDQIPDPVQFVAGDRVYRRTGGEVVTVSEVGTIVPSDPPCQQFRVAGSVIWWRSDDFRHVEPPKLTDAERLAALQAYLKALGPVEKGLRARVTRDMGIRHVERVGAYLPDGTKIAAVGYSEGNRTAKVVDAAAALAWCLKQYPGEVQTVQVVRPAFLKKLLDVAGSLPVGKGLDPETGEELPFIEVTRGDPYVTVTTTSAGVGRMEALALGFTRMLEGAPGGRLVPKGQHDPSFADRLENGAYDRG
jgi:hypothetical protein